MLFIRKPNPFATELLTIDFVFGFQIFDQRLLATVDPAGKEGQDELEAEILHIPGLALEKHTENRPKPARTYPRKTTGIIGVFRRSYFRTRRHLHTQEMVNRAKGNFICLCASSRQFESLGRYSDRIVGSPLGLHQ
jgi:hypothetical protein